MYCGGFSAFVCRGTDVRVGRETNNGRVTGAAGVSLYRAGSVHVDHDGQTETTWCAAFGRRCTRLLSYIIIILCAFDSSETTPIVSWFLHRFKRPSSSILRLSSVRLNGTLLFTARSVLWQLWRAQSEIKRRRGALPITFAAVMFTRVRVPICRQEYLLDPPDRDVFENDPDELYFCIYVRL